VKGTLALLLLAATPSVAFAQNVEQPPDETRRAAAQFAACLVDRRIDEARVIVIRRVFRVQRIYPRFIRAGCLPEQERGRWIGMMRFPSDTLHRVLADELVRRDFGPTYVPSFPSEYSGFSDRPPVFGPTELAALSTRQRDERLRLESEQLAWWALANISYCMTIRQPMLVHRLLMTQVTSDAESTAMSALRPHLAPCVPAGHQIRIRLNDIRGFMALAFYEEAAHATGLINSIPEVPTDA
jgi:hypothetical protein